VKSRTKLSVMAMSVPRGPGFAQMLKEGAKVSTVIQIMLATESVCAVKLVVPVDTVHVWCARQP